MDVPADIREKAADLCVYLDIPTNYRTVATIAQALLSERLAQKERDAEIVQPFTIAGGQGGAFVRKAAWSILDAIRQS